MIGKAALSLARTGLIAAAALAEELDRCIRDMLADGTLEAIHGKYR